MSWPPRCNNRNDAQNAMSSFCTWESLQSQEFRFLLLLEMTPSATVATESAPRYASQRNTLNQVLTLYLLRLPKWRRDSCKVRLTRTNTRSSQSVHNFRTCSGNNGVSLRVSRKTQLLKTSLGFKWKQIIICWQD